MTQTSTLQMLAGASASLRMLDEHVVPRDPYLVGRSSHGTHRRRRSLVLFGRIVDAIPTLGTYKVQPEGGMSTITCGSVIGASNVFGGRDLCTLLPGANVWFLFHADINLGMIIGTEPYYGANPRRGHSDYVFQGSRTGLHADPALSLPFRSQSRGVVNWSGDRPFDSVPGERGFTAGNGVRMLIDDMHAQVGVGEACGLFTFAWDRLLRIAGIHLQSRSLCLEEDQLDDEGELHHYRGHAIYPWESLGGSEPDGPTPRQFTAEQAQIEQPYYSAREPAHDKLRGYHRYLELGGYLGQPYLRSLSAAPRGYGSSGSQNSSTETGDGLFMEHVSLTGGWSVRSRQRVLIAKTSYIPRVARGEEPADSAAGDGDDKYMASGHYGQGDPHKVTADSTHTDPTQAVYEMEAYVFAWEDTHPLYYHKKEWSLQPPDHSDLQGFSSGDVAALSRRHDMQPATRRNIRIDHRYGDVSYATGTASLSMLDDGSIVLRSAQGAALVLDSHAKLSAPGDVWTRAGRDAVSWGGRSVHVRGRRHVNVSTTTGSIRLKANENAWITAGRGGQDGMVLLECLSSGNQYDFGRLRQADEEVPMGDATTGYGIVMVTPRSTTGVLGQNIYLRTGDGAGIGRGNIVLDADQEKVLTYSSEVAHTLPEDGRWTANYVWYDSEADEQVAKTHILAVARSAIDSPLYLNGELDSERTIRVNNGNIFVDDGHIFTSQSPAFDGLVGVFPPGGLNDLFRQEQEIQEELHRQSIALYAYFEAAWWSELMLGHFETLAMLRFSFPTTQQLGVGADWVIPEDPWQHGREAGDFSAWSEPAIVSPSGAVSFPYPGQLIWQEQTPFVRLRAQRTTNQMPHPHDQYDYTQTYTPDVSHLTLHEFFVQNSTG